MKLSVFLLLFFLSVSFCQTLLFSDDNGVKSFTWVSNVTTQVFTFGSNIAVDRSNKGIGLWATQGGCSSEALFFGEISGNVLYSILCPPSSNLFGTPLGGFNPLLVVNSFGESLTSLVFYASRSSGNSHQITAVHLNITADANTNANVATIFTSDGLIGAITYDDTYNYLYILAGGTNQGIQRCTFYANLTCSNTTFLIPAVEPVMYYESGSMAINIQKQMLYWIDISATNAQSTEIHAISLSSVFPLSVTEYIFITQLKDSYVRMDSGTDYLYLFLYQQTVSRVKYDGSAPIEIGVQIGSTSVSGFALYDETPSPTPNSGISICLLSFEIYWFLCVLM